MKNKRILLLVLLSILFMPIVVIAEECDSNSIIVESIDVNDKTDYVDELSPISINGNSIGLNLKMYNVGDYINYKLKLKNTSDLDYYLDEKALKVSNDFFDYSVFFDDNSNIIKSKSEKNINLTIQYKEGVDKNKLIDGKYVDNSDILLLLSDSKGGIMNHLTGISVLFYILLIILIGLIYFIVLKKKNKIIIIIVAFVSLLPIKVYADCIYKFDVKTKIEIETLPTLNETVVGLSNETDSCVTKYSGNVTDEVGKTVTASKVYFDKCGDKRNVIFANTCWQVIRTTETGGTKMMYNGEPLDGKCEGSRPDHNTVSGSNYSTREYNGNVLFGKTYTYDFENHKFTLKDTKTVNVSSINKRELLGYYYTCGNTSNVCDGMDFIGGWLSDTTAMISAIFIVSSDYYDIGFMPFNVDYLSPTMVGYMYNKTVENHSKRRDETNYMFGSSYDYDENTNTYSLTGNTVTTSTRAAFEDINSTRYTCWNTTGTCDTLAFIYFLETGYRDYYYYIDIKNGELLNDILNNMLNAEDVNKIDSTIKSHIDVWYEKNLLDYTSKLEDAVYCNNRSIRDLGGWDPNGNFRNVLSFANNVSRYDLSCENITDQFSIKNDKAKLKYSIALMTTEELSNINVENLLNAGWYWVLSPTHFAGSGANNKGVLFGNVNSGTKVADSKSVRPAISLKNDTYIFSGTGSESDPWIVK